MWLFSNLKHGMFNSDLKSKAVSRKVLTDFLGHLNQSLMGETVRKLTKLLIPVDRAWEISVSEHSHFQGIRRLESTHFGVCSNSC